VQTEHQQRGTAGRNDPRSNRSTITGTVGGPNSRSLPNPGSTTKIDKPRFLTGQGSALGHVNAPRGGVTINVATEKKEIGADGKPAVVPTTAPAPAPQAPTPRAITPTLKIDGIRQEEKVQ
jgi:hypothetical protein